MPESSIKSDETVVARGRFAFGAEIGVGWCWMLGAGILAGLVLFVWRGVWRGAHGSLDFTMVFSAAKLWWQGSNPYDFEAGYATFVAADGSGRPKDPVWFSALYPPATYAVLGPIAVGSWGLAKGLWLAISVFSMAMTCLCGGVLVRRAGVAGLWLGVLLACWLAFGPVHTTLAMGQFGLVVLGLCCPAILIATRDESNPSTVWLVVGAGLALGLAGALKPQLAGPVGLAIVFLGRYRLAGMALVVFGAVFAVSALRLMGEAGAGWIDAWRLNLRQFSGVGFADPRPVNAYVYQMINVAPLAYRWLPETAAKWLSLLPFGLTVLVGLWSAKRMRVISPSSVSRSLLLVSVLCVAGLVSVYHRGYDAVFLAFPVIWAAGVLRQNGFSKFHLAAAWLVLGAAMVFAVPGPAALSTALNRGWLPPGLGNTGWFQVLLLGHQQWGLLLVWAALIGVLVVERLSAAASMSPDTEASA